MQNQIKVFENKEFGKVSVLTIDGKQYFPATECAVTLGYSNPQEAVRRHCLDDGCVKHAVIDTLGRTQEMKFIAEGNLYRLIVRSKLPAAVRFEKWVFDEVLPSIRKHGAYATGDTLDRLTADPAYVTRLINQLTSERGKKEALENYVDVLAPKARYHDLVLQCDTPIPVSVIAKDYGLTANAFNKILHGFRVQYSVGGTWVLYKEYGGMGYTISKTYYVNGRASSIHTYWTQKGRKFIYGLLRFHGLLPQVEREGGIVCRT